MIRLKGFNWLQVIHSNQWHIPNPAKDRFEIRFSSSGYAEYLLNVYDATGRLVYESIVGSDGSILLGKDDIGETGSFIYHIYSKDRGEHSSGKFLLQ